MSSIPFRLIPFTDGGSSTDPYGSSLTDGLSITGQFGVTADTLEVVYRLQGDLSQLSLPLPANDPERRDGLWQTTCLELFLAQRGANGYWEFNLSPAGHWNVYRLEGYRQELTSEPAYQQLPFQVKHQEQPLGHHQVTSPGQAMTMTVRCPLPPDVQGKRVEGGCETACETAFERAFERAFETVATTAGHPELEVGITAVIEHSDGRLSYWALHHPAPEADFHLRGGFRIRIP